MGAALQTAGAAELAAELTCCACSSVCGLVARNASTRAKFRYWSLLLMATVTCIVLLVPGLRQIIYKIPNFCNKVVSVDTCDKLIGFNAVYRILFSLTLFHFILAIFTLRVERVKTCRARFNNGLWMFKVGLIIGITVGSFYIPKQTGFFRIWMYVSLTGGFMFAMFQIILVIDFGHSWSLSWANKLEKGYTKLWYAAMTMVTFVLFAMSGCAAASFYLFFTHPPDVKKCHANVFYIGFISIQCIVASIVSVLPTIQRELAGAGLLQSAVVILYTMYLTFNTLIAEPDSFCNPLGAIIVEYDTYTGVSGQTIFGCMVTLALLVFAFTVRTDTSYLGKYGLALAESDEFAMDLYHDDKNKEGVEQKLETGGKEVLLDEYVGYNYSFFHLIMSLASLHILMVITNWHSPDDSSNNLKRLVKNWASVWVQMASSFVCVLVYIWFLVTPLIKTVWGPLFGVYPIRKPPQRSKSHGKPPKDDKPGEGSKSSKSIDSKSESTKSKSRSESKRQDQEVSFSTDIPYYDDRKHGQNERSKKSSQQRKHDYQNKVDEKCYQRRNSFDTASPILKRSDSMGSETGPTLRKTSRMRPHDYDVKYNSNGSIISVISNVVSRSRHDMSRNDTMNGRKIQKLDDFRFRQRKKYPDSPLYLLQKNRHEHTSDISRDLARNNRGQMKNQDISRDNRGHDLAKHTRDIKDNQGHDLTKSRRESITQNRGPPDLVNETHVRNSEYRTNHRDDKTNDIINEGLRGHDISNIPATKPYAEDTTNISKLKLEAENSLLQQRINEYNSSVHALSMMAESCDSIKPASTFGKRPQNPEVAKEILKLQWKILRSQAKMVKIQERIIRLQAAEHAAENENAARDDVDLRYDDVITNDNADVMKKDKGRNIENQEVQNKAVTENPVDTRIVYNMQDETTRAKDIQGNGDTTINSCMPQSANLRHPLSIETAGTIGINDRENEDGRNRGRGGGEKDDTDERNYENMRRATDLNAQDEKGFKNDISMIDRRLAPSTTRGGRNWDSGRRRKELG